MAVKPIPDGYHAVTPYMIVEGAAELIDFTRQAFGAEERFRMPGPGGAIMHAEIRIGDSVVMMSDASPEYPPTSTMIHLYVEDVDAVYGRVREARLKIVREIGDRDYGLRDFIVADLNGFRLRFASPLR